MMQQLTPAQVAQILGGSLHNASNKPIQNVCIDARQVQAGSLFVGLPGTQQHGQIFAAQALAQNASAAVVEEVQPCALTQIQVAATTQALTELAQYNRQHFSQPLIAVTGNSGKTTVKEMLAAILSQHLGAVLATQGNLNNHLGVPLTLLGLAPQHQAAVVELGANHLGEIDQLAALAQPQLGIITNVTSAHLGEFGSLTAIATAKSELLAHLPVTGWAILNKDDPFYAFWQAKVCSQSLSFGFVDADVCALQLHLDKLGGFTFQVLSPWGEQEFSLKLLGRHNVANALAAITAAGILGVPLSVQAQALAELEPTAGRLSPHLGLQGAVILDDSYNASPGAVKAALDVLAQHAGPKIFALGGLAELGAASQAVHKELGEYARQVGIDKLVVLDNAAPAAQGFGAGALIAPNHAAMAELIQPYLTEDTWVLVKGSRSSSMESLVQLLSPNLTY